MRIYCTSIRKFYAQCNKNLRKIFGPKRDDQTGEWRRLHNGELHDLYGKPDIHVIRIVKSRRLRWPGHVTRMGNERGTLKLHGSRIGYETAISANYTEYRELKF